MKTRKASGKAMVRMVLPSQEQEAAAYQKGKEGEGYEGQVVIF